MKITSIQPWWNYIVFLVSLFFFNLFSISVLFFFFIIFLLFHSFIYLTANTHGQSNMFLWTICCFPVHFTCMSRSRGPNLNPATSCCVVPVQTNESPCHLWLFLSNCLEWTRKAAEREVLVKGNAQCHRQVGRGVVLGAGKGLIVLSHLWKALDGSKWRPLWCPPNHLPHPSFPPCVSSPLCLSIYLVFMSVWKCAERDTCLAHTPSQCCIDVRHWMQIRTKLLDV